MAKDKKLVEAITSMEEDFAQWYTDVVRKAELIDYSSVKGCMILRPAGYAIWENIQKILERDLHFALFPLLDRSLVTAKAVCQFTLRDIYALSCCNDRFGHA